MATSSAFGRLTASFGHFFGFFDSLYPKKRMVMWYLPEKAIVA